LYWSRDVEMLWGCIVYLPVFFISELNFIILMLVSFISPQGLDLRRNQYDGVIVLKGDILYIIRRRRKEELAHFDTLL
jgi:hypothetical protein